MCNAEEARTYCGPPLKACNDFELQVIGLCVVPTWSSSCNQQNEARREGFCERAARRLREEQGMKSKLGGVTDGYGLPTKSSRGWRLTSGGSRTRGEGESEERPGQFTQNGHNFLQFFISDVNSVL